MRRFLIQEATPFDFDDLRRFYADHPDDHVMLRSATAVNQAIEEGVFLIAQDTYREVGDRIFAAAAVYTVSSYDDQGLEITLKEAGGSNVSEAYRGFGVHKVFHWARALHKFITEPNGFDGYFGAIICPNPPSVSNISKAGFVDWSSPPTALVEERAGFAGEGQHISYYRLPYMALQHHAQQLLMVSNRGHLSRKGTSGAVEQVETHLNLESLNHMRAVLERVSGGDFSDFETSLRPSLKFSEQVPPAKATGT